MSDMPGSGRRVTEKQADAILRRAVEMQSARAGGDRDGAGVTLDQLYGAAGEIGVDADLVQRAADEVLRQGAAGALVRVLGGPWTMACDRLVPGQVDRQDWPALVAEIRAMSKRVGEPTMVGNSFEWVSRQPDTIHIALTPAKNGTRVRLTANFNSGVGLYLCLPGLASCMLGFMIVGLSGMDRIPAAAAIFVVALTFGALVAGRRGFAKFCEGRRQEVRRLFVAIEDRISSKEAHADTEGFGIDERTASLAGSDEDGRLRVR